MKYKAVIFILLALALQNCSWICRFFISNTSDKPVSIEIKLNKTAANFPIFHYREFYLHETNGEKIKDDTKEFLADTLEDYSHIKFTLPAHTAVEIARLQNDKYEKHDQYFINGRVFNLESLALTNNGKETKITPETFDTYFKKGKYGEVFYYVK